MTPIAPTSSMVVSRTALYPEYPQAGRLIYPITDLIAADEAVECAASRVTGCRCVDNSVAEPAQNGSDKQHYFKSKAEPLPRGSEPSAHVYTESVAELNVKDIAAYRSLLGTQQVQTEPRLEVKSTRRMPERHLGMQHR